MSDDYRPHDVEWTPERVARYWSEIRRRPGIDSTYFGTQAGPALARYVRRIIPLEGREVLDYGCGTGAVLDALLGSGLRCAGLEFSDESARTADARLRGRPGFRGVVHAAGLPTPIADASVDVVFFTEVIEHLLDEQLAPTLAELRRLLTPGGHLIVTTPNEEDLAARAIHCPDCGARFHPWQHVRSFDSRTLRATLEAAGFVTQSVEAVDLALHGRMRASALPLARYALRRLTGRSWRTPNLVYVGRR